MSELIDNLRILARKYEQQLQDLRGTISQLDVIPKANALLGRCFKYQNGTFGFRIGSWTYKRVIGVMADRLLVDCFVIERKGLKVEITYGMIDYVTNFESKHYIEITEKQYMKAHAKMVKQIVQNSKTTDR